MDQTTYSVFENEKLLCRGALTEILPKLKKKTDKNAHLLPLIFSDATGKVMDFNLRGTEAEVLKRLEVYLSEPSPTAPAGPGRPKLGVISREVSLLPRHWEWLAAQPGGASATLRKLVEDAKKNLGGASDVKRAQELTYRFMSVLAGDRPDYEEALRALYRKDGKTFRGKIAAWPKDVRERLLELAEPVFTTKSR